MAQAIATDIDSQTLFQLYLAARFASQTIMTPHLRQAGLTHSECLILSSVGNAGEMQPSLISRLTGLDKVRGSRCIATLRSAGILVARPNPTDGRSLILTLTKKGRRICGGLPEIASAMDGDLSEILTEGETRTLNRLLGKLIIGCAGEQGDIEEAA